MGLNIDFSIYKKSIKGDFSGGLTAAIIALPMGLAFGMASGLGAAAGLYTAIALAIVAAFVGGTKTLISDPTGPMALVAALVIAEGMEIYGGVENAMPYITGTFVMAGLFQFLFGFLKIAQYVKYISYPVISGFMGGIGCIIIILQLNELVGAHNPPGGVLGVIMHPDHCLNHLVPEATFLGLGTILLIYIVPKINPKLPATLISLVVMTIISLFVRADFYTIGEISTEIPSIDLGFIGSFDSSSFGSMFANAIALAALGTVDTLLSSVVADNLTKTKHNGNRELFGQGLGNLLCGLIGALPGAGSTTGTVININSGGRSNLSGIFKGLLLGLMVIFLGGFIAYVPTAVLAGILMTVGIGIIDFKGIKKLVVHPQQDTLVLALVLLITVFHDLLVAVAVGMVLSSFQFMSKMSQLVASNTKASELEKVDAGLKIPAELEGKVHVQILDGPLFFGFTDKFRSDTVVVEGIEALLISMHKVPFVDTSGLYAIADIYQEYAEKGIEVCIVGVQDSIFKQFEEQEIIPQHIPEEKFYNTIRTTIKYLNYLLIEAKQIEQDEAVKAWLAQDPRLNKDKED
jgi:SulP family sulfate permease